MCMCVLSAMCMPDACGDWKDGIRVPGSQVMDSYRQPFGPSAKTSAFWPPSLSMSCVLNYFVMSISLNLSLSSWLGCRQTTMSRFLFMLGPELIIDTALSPVS